MARKPDNILISTLYGAFEFLITLVTLAFVGVKVVVTMFTALFR